MQVGTVPLPRRPRTGCTQTWLGSSRKTSLQNSLSPSVASRSWRRNRASARRISSTFEEHIAERWTQQYPDQWVAVLAPAGWLPTRRRPTTVMRKVRSRLTAHANSRGMLLRILHHRRTRSGCCRRSMPTVTGLLCRGPDRRPYVRVRVLLPDLRVEGRYSRSSWTPVRTQRPSIGVIGNLLVYPGWSSSWHPIPCSSSVPRPPGSPTRPSSTDVRPPCSCSRTEDGTQSSRLTLRVHVELSPQTGRGALAARARRAE